MKAYCSSGAVLRDMANASIRDVCVVWRKGLGGRGIFRITHAVICSHCCVMCSKSTCLSFGQNWKNGTGKRYFAD